MRGSVLWQLLFSSQVFIFLSSTFLFLIVFAACETVLVVLRAIAKATDDCGSTLGIKDQLSHCVPRQGHMRRDLMLPMR